MPNGPQLFNLLPQGFIGPPRGPFRLNRSSPPAAKLYRWWPLITHDNVARDLSGNRKDAAATSIDHSDFSLQPDFGTFATQLAGASTAKFFEDLSFGWATGGGPSGGPISITFWNYVPSPDIASAAFGNQTSLTARISANVPWSDGILYWDYGDANGAGRETTDYSSFMDAWVHVGLVATGGSGTFQGIYLNGRLQASNSNSSEPDALVDSFRINHAVSASSARNHKGRIFDMRVYSRVLTAEEMFMLQAPDTRWDLYYETGQRTYIFPAHFPAVAAAATGKGAGSLGSIGVGW